MKLAHCICNKFVLHILQQHDNWEGERLMKKRILSLLTACVLLLGTTPAAFAALSNFIPERSYAGQFTDVPASAWYYENVKTAYELGLVNGSSASTYSPDDNITVAEVQTLVARIHSTYYGNTIAPVSGAWYTPYIEYCIEHIDREICSMAYMQDGAESSRIHPLPALILLI